MIRRHSLSGYVGGLLSKGQTSFTAQDAEDAIGVARGPFLDAAERLQRRGLLVKPRQGFYVVVPPQFQTSGAPPPSWYVDDLMRREDERYYVGLLKAAEIHGATHQAAMEFQVVTAKRLPSIRLGRSPIVFYFRKHMDAVNVGIEWRETDTGTMAVSSPALTALDLLRYPHASGGIDTVATVLEDLGPGIDPEQLATLSTRVERPVVQRLGYLLVRLERDVVTKPMFEALRSRRPLPWTELHLEECDQDSATEHLHVDDRWRVVVRRSSESDR